MSKFEHSQLANFAQPASDTEELKMGNAILKAVSTSNILKHNKHEMFE